MTKVPLKKRPKKAKKCTIVDDCAHIAESGLKPPFRLSRREQGARYLCGGRNFAAK